MTRSILFIGGTGIISSACVREALAKGYEVTLLNRSQTELRPIPEEVELLRADIRDAGEYKSAVAGREFDSVINFIAFTPEHIERDINLFHGSCGQYVFISSASAYQKPLQRLPITESTPLTNPYWQYSRDKIACEDLLIRYYRENGFPATIVRPSHTYDKTLLPFEGGYGVVRRMRQNLPVVIHGDGTSLWTLTYNRDFARAFVSLLANKATIGESFHITSDEVLTWNQIYAIVAEAAGIREVEYIRLSSETIAEVAPEWGPSFLGDKSYSVMFDNSKIKSVAHGWQALVPFAEGAAKVMAFYEAHPELTRPDPKTDALLEKIAQKALAGLGRN